MEFEILTIIRKNISALNFINDNKGKYKINVNRLYLAEINIDIHGNKKYSQDIIDYFKDFGGICLFELQYKKKFSAWLKELIGIQKSINY